MMPPRPLEAVTERDIDLLILEELLSDDGFRDDFLKEVSALETKDIVGAWHSVSDPALGESDLILITEDQSAKRHATLIENKVDAPPQPQQAARYRKRGRAGIERDDWHNFTTCIIAPEKYLNNIGDAQLYDSSVSYEWMADHLAKSSSLNAQRRKFRREMILQAIEQNRRGYSPKHDERVTAFWIGYWKHVGELFPELAMPEPKSKPARSHWIDFRPSSLPQGFKLLHKLGDGVVDLQTPISSKELQTFASSCGQILHDDIEVVKTNKSCSIRISVPQLDCFKDYGSQRESSFEGMKAAYRLASLASAVVASDPRMVTNH